MDAMGRGLQSCIYEFASEMRDKKLYNHVFPMSPKKGRFQKEHSLPTSILEAMLLMQRVLHQLIWQISLYLHRFTHVM